MGSHNTDELLGAYSGCFIGIALGFAIFGKTKLPTDETSALSIFIGVISVGLVLSCGGIGLLIGRIAHNTKNITAEDFEKKGKE